MNDDQQASRHFAVTRIKRSMSLSSERLLPFLLRQRTGNFVLSSSAIPTSPHNTVDAKVVSGRARLCATLNEPGLVINAFYTPGRTLASIRSIVSSSVHHKRLALHLLMNMRISPFVLADWRSLRAMTRDCPLKLINLRARTPGQRLDM